MAQALGIVYPYGVGEIRLYWAGWFRLYEESIRLGRVGFGYELFVILGGILSLILMTFCGKYNSVSTALFVATNAPLPTPSRPTL